MANATIDTVSLSSGVGGTTGTTDVVRASFTTDLNDSGMVITQAGAGWPDDVQSAVDDDVAAYDQIRAAIPGVDAIAQSSNFTGSGVEQPVVIVNVRTDTGFETRATADKTGDWAGTLISELQDQIAAFNRLTGR